MNHHSGEGSHDDVRQWSAAEKAAFARHEDGQRRREAGEMSWTQKLEALGRMNELAYQLRRKRQVP
jgi:hypothetical protein